MRVLLVEDDADVAEELAVGLARQGYEVEHVATGRDALARYRDADLVLLDLLLPDLDGLEVCRRLRAESSIPIIAVTARSEELDRVLGLQVGADDYVVKPYGFRELVARIEAVMRRVRHVSGPEGQPSPDRLRVGPLRIDRRERRVLLGEVEIRLTRKEFDLLALLASDPGAVFGREEILRAVWDENWYGSSRTLDVHVASLRHKLGTPSWIETVRGVGFRLNLP